MKQGCKVADSDMHVIEPADLWVRYIDPRFKARAPVGLTEVPRDLAIEWEGRRIPKNTPLSRRMLQVTQTAQVDRYAHAERRGYDARSQLEAMDREGIDVAVLFPSRGLFALAVDGMDPELAAAIARAYNDWLAEFCGENPQRLLGAAMLPPHDVAAAVAEARRAVESLGFRATFMRPNPINGHYWHHPYYDPLWTALEALDVPIGFHEGGSGELRDYLEQTGARFDRGIMGHVVSHPLEMMQAATAMCLGGVCERHPRLRIAFLEGNCAWAPWLLWRMDEHVEWRGAVEAPDLRLKPSEYFRRQCWVSIECDEAPAVMVAAAIRDNIVFSTDYPHGDSKYPAATDRFFELPLPRDTARRILWDNWARLYNVKTS